MVDDKTVRQDLTWVTSAAREHRFLQNGHNHVAQSLQESSRDSGIYIQHMSGAICGRKVLQNGGNWTACRLLQVDFPVRRFLQNRRSHLGGESL
jgi:hypothetical protein